MDLDDEVVICIEIKNGKLGTSVLDRTLATLKLLNQDYITNLSSDCNFGDHPSILGRRTHETTTMIENLLLRLTPTKCLVSARLEEARYDHIARVCQKLNCEVKLMSNQSFQNYEELVFPHLNDYKSLTLLKDVLYSNNGATKVTASTVKCIMSYIAENSGNAQPADSSFGNAVAARSQETSSVLHIETLEITDRVFLDEDALLSLNIISETGTPSHEGLLEDGFSNLFELLGQGLSEMGKKLLRTWLFTPLSNKKLILERYEMLDILMDQSNAVLFKKLRGLLKGMPNVSRIIKQFQTGRANYTTWYSFSKFLANAIETYRLIASIKDDFESVSLITRIKNSASLKALQNLLGRVQLVIDVESSKATKSTVISKGVNVKLDEYREIYNSMEKLLGVVAREADCSLNDEIRKQRQSQMPSIPCVNAVYIPQLGYLVTLDLTFEEFSIDLADLGWQEVFRTATNVYFKNSTVLELDEDIGDIFALISDLEIEILQAFQEELLPKYDMLVKFQNFLLELEVLAAFAFVSQTSDYVKPDICDDECMLEISGGRHPLHETLVETYIPNDLKLQGGKFMEEPLSKADCTWSRNGRKRVAIVTGANQSGKSVFLTQNGLIVFLAHIGCFVPAQKARIGLVDKILTRIRTRESISRNASSFALDSQQMAKCLTLATERSLILIDEFGKGTDVVDGPSIFGSIIDTLARSIKCPRVLACTHFYELFNEDVLTTSIPGVKHYTTEILLSGDGNVPLAKSSSITDNQGITFLFSITEGISKQSFGIYSAKICGVNKAIVDRAQELSNLMEQGHDMITYCASLRDEEMKDFRISQEQVKKFLAWDLDLESQTSSDDLRDQLLDILGNGNSRI